MPSQEPVAAEGEKKKSRLRRVDDLLGKLREKLLASDPAAVLEKNGLVRVEVGEVFALVGRYPKRPVLTRRQHDVLQLIGLDLGNAGIARRLGLSRDTIDYHVSRLLASFGVSGRAALIRKAVLCGYFADGRLPACP